MHGYYSIRRIQILGAGFHVHWTVVLAAGLLIFASKGQPLQAALAVSCYLGVILLHEFGHALFAQRLGYKPENIYISIIHGHCEYEHPYTLKEDSTIAWGGVLAQFAVALPLIVLTNVTSLGKVPYVSTVIAFFGYYSLLIAFVNLTPIRGLDGSLAWRLIPILVGEIRQRTAAKRAAKAVIRRVK